jgi:hypothetical protein
MIRLWPRRRPRRAPQLPRCVWCARPAGIYVPATGGGIACAPGYGCQARPA